MYWLLFWRMLILYFFSINTTFTTDCNITLWFLVFSFSFEISLPSYMCVSMCVHVWKHWEREIRTKERVTVGYIQDFLIFWLSSYWKKSGRPSPGMEGHMNEITKCSYYEISGRINAVLYNLSRRSHIKKEYSQKTILYLF